MTRIAAPVPDPAADEVVIFHNPACTTSRKVLALIRDAGIEPRVVDYQKTPPDSALLKRLAERGGMAVRDLLRKKGTPYSELGLGDVTLGDEALLAPSKPVDRLPPRNVATLSQYSFSRVRTQPLREIGFSDIAGSEFEHSNHRIRFAAFEPDLVHQQEDPRQHPRRSLVAVDEGMVPGHAERIGGGKIIAIRIPIVC